MNLLESVTFVVKIVSVIFVETVMLKIEEERDIMQKCKYCDKEATCHVCYTEWEHYCAEHFFLSNYYEREVVT